MKIKQYKTQKGLINAVHKLLSDRDNWTQGADAEDKHRNAVDPKGPNIERFCVRGALKACAVDHSLFLKTYNCLAHIALRDWGHSVLSVNDISGHKAVIELLETGKTECK